MKARALRGMAWLMVSAGAAAAIFAGACSNEQFASNAADTGADTSIEVPDAAAEGGATDGGQPPVDASSDAWRVLLTDDFDRDAAATTVTPPWEATYLVGNYVFRRVGDQFVSPSLSLQVSIGSRNAAATALAYSTFPGKHAAIRVSFSLFVERWGTPDAGATYSAAGAFRVKAGSYALTLLLFVDASGRGALLYEDPGAAPKDIPVAFPLAPLPGQWKRVTIELTTGASSTVTMAYGAAVVVDHVPARATAPLDQPTVSLGLDGRIGSNDWRSYTDDVVIESTP